MDSSWPASNVRTPNKTRPQRPPYRSRSLQHSSFLVLPSHPQPITTFIMPPARKGLKLKSRNKTKIATFPSQSSRTADWTTHTSGQTSQGLGVHHSEKQQNYTQSSDAELYFRDKSDKSPDNCDNNKFCITDIRKLHKLPSVSLNGEQEKQNQLSRASLSCENSVEDGWRVTELKKSDIIPDADSAEGLLKKLPQASMEDVLLEASTPVSETDEKGPDALSGVLVTYSEKSDLTSREPTKESPHPELLKLSNRIPTGSMIPGPLSLRECDIDQRENNPCVGLRIRTHRFKLIDSKPEFNLGLHPLSKPTNILIRARGNDNRFMVGHDHSVVMSAINYDQLCNAVFQKTEFFHPEWGVVTTFLHMSSNSYLAVCSDTRSIFLESAALAHIDDDIDASSSGMVSVHGSGSSHPLPLFPEDSSTDPDPSCLFIVVTKGPTTLRPAICDDASLSFNSNGTLVISSGNQWDFKILSADEASKFINKKDLKKIFRKSCVVVLVVCR